MRSFFVPAVSLFMLSSLVACVEAPPASPGSKALALSGEPDDLAMAESLAMQHLRAGLALQKRVAELQPNRTRMDPVGVTHVRMQQRLNGVPVYGAQVIVHLGADGRVIAVSDDLLPDVAVNTVPDVTLEEALSLAADTYFEGWGALTAEPRAELFVYRQDGVDHLIWQVQLHRVRGDAQDQMPMMFIDAHTGALLFQYNNLQTDRCTGPTNFYGTVEFDCVNDGGTYYLENQGDSLGTFSYRNGTGSLYDVTSSSSTFSGEGRSLNAIEAHYASEQVYDYYMDIHGRDGIDGAGGPAGKTSHGVGLITSGTSYDKNYVNAFWDGELMTMSYGDGDGEWSDSLTTLDVAGHEMTHGVTQFEAGLVYYGAPGHLNEASSDILGNMVERNVLGQSANTWMVGEDTWTPGVDGDALRYMNDPAADGASYDYADSRVGKVDVHYGSGVPNLAFYLMSEGGPHPRGKSLVEVEGVGADAAGEIWYLALTEYMGPTTSFSEAALATRLAAESLYGEDSPEAQSVQDAWSAVGVVTCTDQESAFWIAAGETVVLPSEDGAAVTRVSQLARWDSIAPGHLNMALEQSVDGVWTEVARLDRSEAGDMLDYTITSGTYRLVVSRDVGMGRVVVEWCR